MLAPITTSTDSPGCDTTTPISPLGPGDVRLPIDMRFNDGHIVAIVGFSTLMVLSSIGNITVLYSIFKSRTKTQINLMLSHLAVADLLVTFLMMPMEIGWAVTVTWEGGDILCRLMSFFRAFGLYLSGFVVMCISVDRYFAVLHPLKAPGDAQRRGRRMLSLAWIASFICSLPQAVVFTTMQHPVHQWFTQCLTYDVLRTNTEEIMYAMFGVVCMYVLPLVTIIYCYSAIILEICRRAVDMGETKMRRSNSGYLCRAKIRTLKMTVTIVAVFVLCWTPYNVMLIWYFVDRYGALKLDPKVQRLLLLFASTNSSFNPLVYGIFNIRGRQQTLPVVSSVSRCIPPLPASLRQQASERSKSARILALRAEAKLPSCRRPTV